MKRSSPDIGAAQASRSVQRYMQRHGLDPAQQEGYGQMPILRQQIEKAVACERLLEVAHDRKAVEIKQRSGGGDEEVSVAPRLSDL